MNPFLPKRGRKMTVTQDQVTAGLQELSLGLFKLYLASASPGATVKIVLLSRSGMASETEHF